ncbi:MAG: M6 family metalloprotease domain-containing protein, partial [Bacteroidaceae bacterium]|nr:M6 family metalloprotease domain-containing protein [Bacteroidaceae bacterium]
MAAVPALKVKRTVKQSDGKSLQIVLCGDESFHFYQTIDGVPVVENEDGSFDYATMDHGNLISTKMLAHETDERSIGEKTFVNLSKKSIIADIQTTWNKRLSARNAHRLKRLEARRAKATGPNRVRKAGATQGEVKGLVILVNFADKKMTRTREEFDDQFNKIGYRKNSHIGSVREYFTSQSYGKLNIDFDVVGPYTVSKNMAYYGKDVGQAGDDEHPTQMVYEAIKLADKDVNFADYDWDGDGEVDQVYVIYAGYGQAQGAASNTIWPHEYVLEGGGYYNVRFDNVRLSTYACSCEFSGTSGTRMDGIGTACHEFTHCLGLPDFYDTSNVTANFGMSFWSVMDSGCYNGSYSGSVPAPYTSYERWVSGWLEPTELNVGCEVEGLRNIVNYPEAYVIYNEANHDEFYLLENHQKNSWDSYSYGKGMLILHVDYDETAWWENT